MVGFFFFSLGRTFVHSFCFPALFCPFGAFPFSHLSRFLPVSGALPPCFCGSCWVPEPKAVGEQQPFLWGHPPSPACLLLPPKQDLESWNHRTEPQSAVPDADCSPPIAVTHPTAARFYFSLAGLSFPFRKLSHLPLLLPSPLRAPQPF